MKPLLEVNAPSGRIYRLYKGQENRRSQDDPLAEFTYEIFLEDDYKTGSLQNFCGMMFKRPNLVPMFPYHCLLSSVFFADAPIEIQWQTKSAVTKKKAFRAFINAAENQIYLANQYKVLMRDDLGQLKLLLEQTDCAIKSQNQEVDKDWLKQEKQLIYKVMAVKTAKMSPKQHYQEEDRSMTDSQLAATIKHTKKVNKDKRHPSLDDRIEVDQDLIVNRKLSIVPNVHKLVKNLTRWFTCKTDALQYVRNLYALAQQQDSVPDLVKQFGSRKRLVRKLKQARQLLRHELNKEDPITGSDIQQDPSAKKKIKRISI